MDQYIIAWTDLLAMRAYLPEVETLRDMLHYMTMFLQLT